jgi:hypothetical protein
VHPGGIVTDLIRHTCRGAEIDAYQIIDETGKRIIDPKEQQKDP